ncbi:DGQHR domain-containing protein [Echinicola vietnamensis]|uniref:DGQHR domain-containing protein n=1 Tax=Echinicola vietnamensis (strain DSM 17526 / LMG 23754 / KMM 6221) TaxID=926556 RepID=L0FUV4_ECHVK|nr:DGQHR domain-containing protein [Echinicola vietnamensis]AGA77679.1 DGQHR domain-containing protein [Echinicola vietnamensis DSM 17526]
MDQQVIIKCLEVIQPIGKFYIGVINYDDLEFISYADVRRLKDEKREVEEYIGIQRPLSPRREKEIGKYVNLIDATFPTSIILAISSKNATYDPEKDELIIERNQNVAKVLDGQHRIAGLNNCDLPGDKFQLNVTIFVDMELEDQAIVFSTINKTHTKVNKSLSYDLFEFATSRSPQRTVHNIARALNQKDGSPFKDKIKILGVAEDNEKETITQATFVEAILRYITKDKMKDRDLYRRGGSPEEYTGNDYEKYFLRPLFLNEEDGKIAQTIWNYFKTIENKWEEAWMKVEPNRILNRSTGFIALNRFLGDIYKNLNKTGQVISLEEYKEIFEKIDLTSEDFTRDNYLPGSGGQSKLYNDLKEKSGI